MKTKETSTREKALAWWHNLSHEKQIDLQHVYRSPSRHPLNAIGLTGREIEEIWRKENSFMGTGLTQSEFIDNCEKYFGGKPNQKQYSQEEVDRLLDQQAARTTAQMVKNNQKQFKTFNESLFKAYIDKFSDEDKIWALRALVKTMPESNLKKHVNSWFE